MEIEDISKKKVYGDDAESKTSFEMKLVGSKKVNFFGGLPSLTFITKQIFSFHFPSSYTIFFKDVSSQNYQKHPKTLPNNSPSISLTSLFYYITTNICFL